jgi:hypothetical protein
MDGYASHGRDRKAMSMSPPMGVHLAVGILTMVGAAIWLSIVNRRRVSKQLRASAEAVNLVPTDRHRAVSNVDLVWRRGDRRRAWALLEGVYRGWETKVFLFAHDASALDRGARAFVGLVAHRLLSVFGLAFDARTADQRGVLVAVEYGGDDARFKIRGTRLIARGEVARRLLGGRSVRLGTWAAPGRISLGHEWFFLQSFYVTPRWIERYVPVATEICERLQEAGVTRRHPEEFTAMPLDLTTRSR